MAAGFALLAAVVSAVFAVAVLRRYVARGRVNRALLWWGIALVMFVVASVMLVVGEIAGWSAPVFRAFYVFGGALTVPWLALGTVETVARDRTTLRVLGVVALVVGGYALSKLLGDAEIYRVTAALGLAWGVLLIIAPARLAVLGSVVLVALFSALALLAVGTTELTASVPVERLPARDLFPAEVRGFSVAGSQVGALLLIVGAVVSAVRMRGRDVPYLIWGNLIIAAGVIVAAAGGFIRQVPAIAIANAVGVSIMYVGFVRTTHRPAP